MKNKPVKIVVIRFKTANGYKGTVEVPERFATKKHVKEVINIHIKAIQQAFITKKEV